MIDDLKQLHNLYLLKEIERYGTVKHKHGERQESAAEHTYSMMILAQYFLPKIEQRLDEAKVFRMLLYDDIIEIEAGDTFILDREGEYHANETEALPRFLQRLPSDILEDYRRIWQEHEEGKTLEAKFCQAIDALDPIIHSMFKYEDWRRNKFTERKLREKKEERFIEFPVMREAFEELVKHLRANNCFLD